MGNKRKLIYFFGLVATVALVGAAQTLAQNAYPYGDQSHRYSQNRHRFDGQATSASLQRQSNSQHARYQQAGYQGYQSSTYVSPPDHRQFATVPQTRVAQRRFGPQRSFNKIGFGIRQDDPFGENQGTGQTPSRPRGFDPFAEPSTDDPFGEEQMAPGGQQNQLTDPFADPPGLRPPPRDLSTREPRSRQPQTEGGADPVLPGDANPGLDAPSLNGSSVLEGNGNEDYPPGTVKPDDRDLPDPFKDPANQRNFGEDRYIPPAGIYRPPGSRRRYQDDYPQPAYEPPQRHYQPQQPEFYQPDYKPAYQPIPGQAPTYQPVYTAPPAQQLVSAPASPVESVYTPTVAPLSAYDKCQACQSDCGGACLGCNVNRCPDFYFSLFGGWSGLKDLRSETGLGSFRTDDGYVFGVALGRRNGRNLRTELEFSTRSHDVTGFFDGSNLTPLSGDIRSYAGMANAYWEVIDVRTRYFKPYVGIGAGFISIDSDIQDANSQTILETGTENDTSLALQYMVGINYKAYRNVDLFVEYRYLRADTFRLDTTVGTSDRYPYLADNVLFGLRWKF